MAEFWHRRPTTPAVISPFRWTRVSDNIMVTTPRVSRPARFARAINGEASNCSAFSSCVSSVQLLGLFALLCGFRRVCQYWTRRVVQ